MRIGDLMNRKVYALRPSDSVRRAVAVFSEHGISGAPVVDEGGRVVGILTEMDILRRLEIGSMEFVPPAPPIGKAVDGRGRRPGLRFKSLSESLEGAGDLTVSQLMTSPVVTARPGDLVQEMAALMVHRRIRRLPVVDEKGVLVGILSRKDLIRMLHGTIRARRTAAGPPGSRTGGAAERKGRGKAA